MKRNWYKIFFGLVNLPLFNQPLLIYMLMNTVKKFTTIYLQLN